MLRRFVAMQAVLALLAVSLASAQTSLTDLPNLSTATLSSATAAAQSSTASVASTSATSTSAAATSTSTSATSASSSPATTASPTVITTTSGGQVPTIAGAGIPTMIIPDTSRAPFMQHSTLPEGTVFITVGAVLAFLGVCVLLWRGLVAWSINRSVKRAALASIRGGNEKHMANWGGHGTGYNPAKGSLYQDSGHTMSMEALTSAGKPLKSHFKDHDAGRSTPPPLPANLFFSPTAHARSDAPRPLTEVHSSRNSSFLPAGYYASPSSHAGAGARHTIVGGATLPPYARSSFVDPSPPASPSLRPSTNHGRDGARHSMYLQPSNSSLAVGVGNRASSDGLAGSRAPSAYLEDLFENHTAMASRDHL